MTGQNYAMEIKRTPYGAFDDYHHYRIGRRIRSQAFHAFIKRLWNGIEDEARTAKSTLTIGLRWEMAPSR
jgi:hypothetical protein